MLMILLQRILVIFFQFCLSIVLYVPFYQIFERIYRKGKPKSFRAPDILIEGKMMDKINLLTGIAMLVVTIIINIFFMLLTGFYLSSILLITMSLHLIVPSKGKKITDNCWVTFSIIGNFIVTLNDHKILIDGERLRGKYDHVIYKEDSPKWLPPHESDLVSGEDYEYMLQAVLKFLEKNRSHGVIQGPGEHVGPYFTKEDMINKYAQKGWKVERCSDGSIKVNPPQRKNLFTRINNLFLKNNQK